MSGILGLYFLDGRKVEDNDLRKMLNSIKHRGPDGSSMWLNTSVGLGHQMLFTTFESLHEKLPLEDKKNNIVITADARIDNREELINALKLDNLVSDSEIILHAYLKWGKGCLKHLLGDFVFAIWDSKERKLFCARDHMGVKPFYYYYVPGNLFIFGSEIKCIFTLPEIKKELNELKVADHLLEYFEDKEITFYKGIYRLPHGHMLEISPQGIKKGEYWSLDPELETRFKSEKDYEEKFRELFFQAVKRRLRSQYPVCFTLSGGLDSSSIVCVASRIMDSPLSTFSCLFNNYPECNEKDYIDEVLFRLKDKVKPIFTEGSYVKPHDNFDSIFHCVDGPFVPVTSFLFWYFNKVLSENNFRIVIGGLGGDIVASHGAFPESNFLKDLKLLALYKEIEGTSKVLKKPAWKIFIRRGIYPMLTNYIFNLKENIFGPSILRSSTLAKDLTEKLKCQGVKTTRWKMGSFICNSKASQFDLLTTGRLSHMFELLDNKGAFFAMEGRYPFIDKELVEYCYSIPKEQIVRNSWDKYILRKSLANILPQKIQWRRKKAGPANVIQDQFIQYGNDRIIENIIKESEHIKEYVDSKKVLKIYNDYKESNAINNLNTIWAVLMLAGWLKQSGLRREKING